MIVVVEGDTDVPFVHKLCVDVDMLPAIPLLDAAGKSNIEKRLVGYARASAGSPHFVVRDLDQDAACAPAWLERNRPADPGRFFLAPFLFTFEVQVGAVVLDGHPLVIGEDVSLGAALASFPRYLLVGSPIVALGFAFAALFLVWSVVSVKRAIAGAPTPRPPYELPENAPAWVKAVERVAARFASPGSRSAAERTSFHYVRLKLVMDPVPKMVAAIAGESGGALGHVVDVGSGRGQLPILLLELGRATSAHAIDWDKDKVAHGRAAAARDGGLALTFEDADVRRAAIPEADTVLLIDVLHYLHLEEQDDVLRRAARALRPGGHLIVREADSERGIRSFLTRLSEGIFTTARFNRGDRVELRPARTIAALLEGEGLETEIRPAWGKTPYSNVWILAKRPPSN